jgi:hypothetical protein
MEYIAQRQHTTYAALMDYTVARRGDLVVMAGNTATPLPNKTA